MDNPDNKLYDSLQEVLKRYRITNMIFMWLAILASYVMFFFGIPNHMWAVAFGLCNMSSVLFFSAFIDEGEPAKPTHSPSVKWDPKKKNDIKPK